MNKNRILLALKDKEDIRILSGYLSGVGFEPTVTKDGAEAVEHAVHEVPTAVIIDIDLPVLDGARVFKIVRHNPHTSKIPFLIIADTAVDLKGFTPGSDTFISRPLNLDIIDDKIRQALFQMDNAQGGGKKVIEGKLMHMSVADILQFLHMNKKEGELKVTLGNSNGVVFVKDGEVYNAKLDTVEKEKALYRLLQWNEGTFEFLPQAIDAAKKIHSSTSNLLMEGMRQIDEVKRIQERFPNKKNLLKMKVDPATLPPDLDPVIFELVRLMKVYPKVEDLVDKCPLPDYEVYWTLTDMLSRGMIEEQKAEEIKSDAAFLTVEEGVNIRERIFNTITGLSHCNYAKIYLLSTSAILVDGFLNMCSHMPDFNVTQKDLMAEATLGGHFGEVAALKLHGGMDLVVFSIPTVKNMGPVMKAFSANMVALILLWDDDVGAEISELAAAKKELLSLKKCPVVHVFAGEGNKAGLEITYRQNFSMRDDEPLFKLKMQDKSVIFDIFQALFGDLMKQDKTAQ